MAIDTVRAECARAKPYPNDAHPLELSPEDVPETYASVCRGDCLDPIIKDGACLVFSKTDQPQAGDFVGFWLHPDAVADGELPRRVKRLYMGLPEGWTLPLAMHPESEAEPLLIFEQVNPPKLLQVRASRVLAMHKVIGEAETQPDGRARMVRHFIGGKPMRQQDED
jgi:hypothetical protein